jgi:hypothetical protein
MIDEEEAHFYYILMDFEQLLEKHGADFVLTKMKQDPFAQLNEWFANSQTPKKDVGKLLC